MPKKVKKGQHKILAEAVGEKYHTIYSYWKHGKLDPHIRAGKYDIPALKDALPKIINRKYQQNREKQWNKTSQPAPPNTEDEVKTYLDETIGDLSSLHLNELQRRNELEKLLMAQIKRKQAENDLIELAAAQKTIELILSTTINQLESLATKTSPLLSVESDSFECQQILNKEVDFIRNQIITDLKKISGGEYVS